jgi:hypothetical protein
MKTHSDQPGQYGDGVTTSCMWSVVWPGQRREQGDVLLFSTVTLVMSMLGCFSMIVV